MPEIADLAILVKRHDAKLASLDPAWRADKDREIAGLYAGQTKMLATTEEIKDSMADLTSEIRALRREIKAEQSRGIGR